jgi:DnaJ-class molecular chaperone
MDNLVFKTKCGACDGTGINSNVTPNEPCLSCSGTGYIISGASMDITELVAKIDAIKAMLDSPTLGMQKMSSNLDDIMVKLDV